VACIRILLDALEQAALAIHNTLWLSGATGGVEHKGRCIHRDWLKRWGVIEKFVRVRNIDPTQAVFVDPFG
jgi:hypothetical protein